MNYNKIAVIITIHNRLAETLECLKSLQKQSIRTEVFLTDDGSDKGVAEKIKEMYPHIRIIEGDGDLYWNRGMYRAWEEAMKNDFDYYLWLNNDTQLVANAIAALLNAANSENNEAIVCGATVNNKVEEKTTYGGYDRNIQIIGLSEKIQYCEFASGNIILIPAKIVKVIGNLDFKYCHSLGDFDYEGRARKKGFKIVQAPNYLGYCERHPKVPKWRDIKIPLSTRIEFLYSPLGRNPIEFFYYDSKQYNYLI